MSTKYYLSIQKIKNLTKRTFLGIVRQQIIHLKEKWPKNRKFGEILIVSSELFKWL
jgi:hypothetical protein